MSELEHLPYRAKVATRELALCVVMCVVVKPRQMFEGTTSLLTQGVLEGTTKNAEGESPHR